MKEILKVLTILFWSLNLMAATDTIIVRVDDMNDVPFYVEVADVRKIQNGHVIKLWTRKADNKEYGGLIALTMKEVVVDIEIDNQVIQRLGKVFFAKDSVTESYIYLDDIDHIDALKIKGLAL